MKILMESSIYLNPVLFVRKLFYIDIAIGIQNFLGEELLCFSDFLLENEFCLINFSEKVSKSP